MPSYKRVGIVPLSWLPYAGPSVVAKISRCSHTREFKVRLFIAGNYQEGADYFTDDKDDAFSTARVMVENAAKHRPEKQNGQ
jgi:hypothetical protein